MSYTENEYKIINEKLHDEIYSLTKQIKIMRDALEAIDNGSRLSRYTICGPSYIQLSAAGLQIIAKEALKQAEDVC